jgi:hypothetical protein
MATRFDLDADGGTRPAPYRWPSTGRRIRLALGTVAAAGLVLILLVAASSATVAADGTLNEPFGVVALSTLALTAAGLTGLISMFRMVRRQSTCGRGGC